MSQLPKVLQLPASTRSMLDEKLRAASYCMAPQMSAWLLSQGFQVSKSAVGRYALTLRAMDARNGDPSARALQGRADERDAPDLRELTSTLAQQVRRLQRKQADTMREVVRLRAELQRVAPGRERLTATPGWRGA